MASISKWNPTFWAQKNRIKYTYNFCDSAKIAANHFGFIFIQWARIEKHFSNDTHINQRCWASERTKKITATKIKKRKENTFTNIHTHIHIQRNPCMQSSWLHNPVAKRKKYSFWTVWRTKNVRAIIRMYIVRWYPIYVRIVKILRTQTKKTSVYDMHVYVFYIWIDKKTVHFSVCVYWQMRYDFVVFTHIFFFLAFFCSLQSTIL